jgi:uncharacterized protein DUF5681
MAAHDGLAEVLDGQDRAAAGQAEIGYKRPPVSRRFHKGQSGNPNGRPKESRNVHKLLKELLNQAVPVREGNRTRSMLKGEAMIRVLVRKALQADERALRAIMSALQMTGRLDELNDAERAKYGVLVVCEPLHSTDEWELLYGPHRAADRKRYLAMSDDLQADFRAAGEKTPLAELTPPQQPTFVPDNQSNGTSVIT